MTDNEALNNETLLKELEELRKQKEEADNMKTTKT